MQVHKYVGKVQKNIKELLFFPTVFPRASERRFFIEWGPVIHFHIFTHTQTHIIVSSSHSLCFTSTHVISTSSHILIFTSAHVIFTSSHLITFAHLIFTPAHLRIIFSPSHLHIFTSLTLSLSLPLSFYHVFFLSSL